jgi:hypothetical protein
LSDNQRARVLRPDGNYARVPVADNPPHRSQSELLALAATRDAAAREKAHGPLVADPFDPMAAENGAASRDGTKRKKKKSSTAK